MPSQYFRVASLTAQPSQTDSPRTKLAPHNWAIYPHNWAIYPHALFDGVIFAHAYADLTAAAPLPGLNSYIPTQREFKWDYVPYWSFVLSVCLSV